MQRSQMPSEVYASTGLSKQRLRKVSHLVPTSFRSNKSGAGRTLRRDQPFSTAQHGTRQLAKPVRSDRATSAPCAASRRDEGDEPYTLPLQHCLHPTPYTHSHCNQCARPCVHSWAAQSLRTPCVMPAVHFRCVCVPCVATEPARGSTHMPCQACITVANLQGSSALVLVLCTSTCVRLPRPLRHNRHGPALLVATGFSEHKRVQQCWLRLGIRTCPCG
jgi:hypothetical protein